MKNDIQNKNFALRLALKERLRGTPKWSIDGMVKCTLAYRKLPGNPG